MNAAKTIPILRIEFLYWKECPSYDVALQRLREVLAEHQIAAPIHLVEVTTERQAEVLRFPGSPTIRINDQDLFPAPDGPYGLTCRVYHADDGRVTPLPTQEMLERAVRDHTLSKLRNPNPRTDRRRRTAQGS